MAEILLLEDMGHLRRMLAFVLREAGHEVTESGNGAIVYDRERISSVDMLVTDIDMPDVNGIEAIRAAKQINPDIRIVAMSGGGMLDGSDYLAACLDLGASDILLKPFEPDELVARVTKALAASRLAKFSPRPISDGIDE